MQLKKKFCYLACKPPVYVFQERQHWINLELVSGIPWRIDIALKAKKTRRFLGLFLYDPNIKAFLMPNEWVMNKCFLSKADIDDDHFEGRFRRTSWMLNLPRKVYGAKSVDLSTHLLQTMPGTRVRKRYIIRCPVCREKSQVWNQKLFRETDL